MWSSTLRKQPIPALPGAYCCVRTIPEATDEAARDGISKQSQQRHLFDRELSSLAHQGLFRLDCPFLLLSRLDRSNATGTPERRKRSGLVVGQRQHNEE